MILKTKELFQLQDILQQRILNEHQVSQEETMSRRILALLVELGELANETRCFKYWSLKGPSEKRVILEEYVDGIHFLLCIGIDIHHTPDEIEGKGTQKDLSELFMDVYCKTAQYREHTCVDTYMSLFSTYIWLGECLQFRSEEICSSYFEKNKENHHRQDQKY